MEKPLLFFSAVLLLLAELSGQSIRTPDSFNSFIWDFDRLSADSGALALHYAVHYQDKTSEFSFLDPIAKVSYNSGYPRGYNDGPVWKGKGLNGEIHAGISGSLGRISYTFQPVIYYAQNLEYELAPGIFPGINPFGYQFLDHQIPNKIDWVQRYGNDPLMKFHPGQSEVRLNFGGFSTSITTQNYGFGPAVFNPILLSNNAPGIPKLNIGTNGPVDVGYKDFQVGRLEANLIYGLMKESDYFYNDQALHEWSYFNSLFLAYSPVFLPTLSIGFGKVLYMNNKYWEPEDLLASIVILDDGTLENGRDTGNDKFDQLASLSLNWNFPDIGFRTYFEFAKNDFNGNLRRIITEPEHSRAYTIGFQKLLKFSKSDLMISYEHTNLTRNSSFLYRATATFYEHFVNQQGYTNLGQLMGAGIGPGGNTDNLQVKVKRNGTVFGFLMQRIEFNKDFFLANVQDFNRHDLEYTFGGNFYKSMKGYVLGINTTMSYNFNKYYQYKNDVKNLYLELYTQIKLNHD